MTSRDTNRWVRALAIAGIAVLLAGGLYLLAIAMAIFAGDGLWAGDLQVVLPVIGVALLGAALPLAWRGSGSGALVKVGLAVVALAAWVALFMFWSLNSR